jgi:transposase-like protein
MGSVLHWKGRLISQINVDLPKPRPPYRTSEDTVSLIGRLAVHYDDSMIAKVLNQQQRRTATGMSFTPVNVATIRKRHGIPPCQGGDVPDPDGEVMSVHQAATELGITASTLYRWLNDGFVPGEQITPGAPWRIGLTQSIRELVADDAPPAGSPSRSPPRPRMSPGRPCCSVSSAANSAPPTSAPDAGKACVSSYPPAKTGSSSHPEQ